MRVSGGRRTTWRGPARAGLAAAAVVALGAPSAAAREVPPTPPEPFGVNNGVLWPDGNKLLPTATHVDAIGRTGLGSVRAIPFWNLLEPEAPDPRTGVRRFDWTRTDAMAELLARNGLRWDAILGFSSPWGGTVLGTTAGPPRVGPFAAYASAVARRYGRDGEFWALRPDLPYVPITSYQVWNEPNIPVGLTAIDPARYAELYIATRAAVLEADPHARVAIGALVHSAESGDGNARGYLERMFRARPDLAGGIDALGVTIYRATPERVLRQVASARRALDDLGERSTPIDVLETGWTTQGALPLTEIAPVSEQTRAGFLREVVDRLVAADCGVATVTPFAWVTAEDIPVEPSAWFGLADRATAALRPSGRAFVDAVQAARDPGAPAAGRAVCDRPDLPRLLEPRRRVRAPFTVQIARACARGRYTVRMTHGPEVEPFQRFELTLSSGTRRVLTDPDGAGPALAPVAKSYGIPRKKGRVRVVAFDGLDRVRARGEAVLRRCPPRRRR